MTASVLVPGRLLGRIPKRLLDTSSGEMAKRKVAEERLITHALTAHLASQFVFNVMDYGATGNGKKDDTAAIQSTITAAAAVKSTEASGALVYFPSGTYIISGSLTVPAQIHMIGAGTRATRILSHYNGYAICVGSLTGALAYGNGIELLSLRLSSSKGGAIQAIGTAGFSARDLYIVGLVSSENTGIFLDGGNAANIFSVLDNVICNHVKVGLHIGTSGRSTTTSVTATGFNALTDMVPGGKGIQVDRSNGQGSRFFGGNMEKCETGIAISGVACQFFGMRFEANQTDLLLDRGAKANQFFGSSGWSAVRDQSGNTSNVFLGNRSSSYAQYPLDTIEARSLPFGSGTAEISNPAELTIANNEMEGIPIGNCSQLLVYDSGVTADVAQLLLSPHSKGAKLKLTQANTTYTTTPGNVGTINFSIDSSTLKIENKLGSPTTLQFMLSRLV